MSYLLHRLAVSEIYIHHHLYYVHTNLKHCSGKAKDIGNKKVNSRLFFKVGYS